MDIDTPTQAECFVKMKAEIQVMFQQAKKC